MIKFLWYPFLPILVFMIFSGNPVSAQQAKVNGTWNLSVQTSLGNGTPTFVFKHETEATFIGTYSGQLGSAAVKGTVKGNDVQFEFTIDNNLIEYKGSVEGNTMKGTVKLGTQAEGTFSGNRKVE